MADCPLNRLELQSPSSCCRGGMMGPCQPHMCLGLNREKEANERRKECDFSGLAQLPGLCAINHVPEHYK